MSESEPSSVLPAWHEALVYAFTGVRREGLGRQRQPDLDLLVELLATSGDGPAPVVEHQVPADLRAGISAAQFWAVTTEVQRRLAGLSAAGRPVVAERPLDADERRLSQERPPHH